LHPGYPSGREFLDSVKRGELVQASPSRLYLADFGPGERAVISLAIEHPDWVLLLDDVRPFREATTRGLSVVCTPVLTVALFREGMINAGEALHTLTRLAALQTVSPHLIAAALAQLGASLKDRGG